MSYLYCIGISFAIQSVTWAAAPCCFPPKFEGSFSFQSINFIGTTGEIDASEMKFNRSVDNVGKKEAISVLYQNLNGKSYPPYFILNDYQNGMEYIVQDNKCEKRPITLPMPSNCLPDGATQVIQDNLGAENEMLSLNRYVYKKPSSNLTDNVFVTEQNCYPVLYTLTMVDGRTVQQMLISGMSVGIKNPYIFNVPDVCKQTEPHGKILSQDFRMRLFFGLSNMKNDNMNTVATLVHISRFMTVFLP